MNDSSSGQNRFEGWRDAVADAVDFAEQFPLELRSGIVQALLTSSESRGTAASPKGSDLGANGVPSFQELGGIAAVAQDAGVDENTLGRFIQIAEDGTVHYPSPSFGDFSRGHPERLQYHPGLRPGEGAG